MGQHGTMSIRLPTCRPGILLPHSHSHMAAIADHIEEVQMKLLLERHGEADT